MRPYLPPPSWRPNLLLLSGFHQQVPGELVPFEDEDDDEHERLYSAKISPRVGRGEIFGLNRYQSSCYIRVRIPSNTISWGLPAQAAVYIVCQA